MRTYSLLTLGCKVNQYESQTYRERLAAMGLQPATPGRFPDLTLVNTCAVTANACRKSRQLVRRAAQNTPVIVLGCDAGAEAQALAAIPGVVAVIGHQADPLASLGTVLAGLQWVSAEDASAATSPHVFHPNTLVPAMDPRGLADSSRRAHGLSRQPFAPVIVQESATRTWGRIRYFAGRHRAFLKVQDGCDAYCTYCIIPRLRGQTRCQPVGRVLEEARGLVAAGFRELVLTGIFLGAYGQTTAVRRRWTQPSQLPHLVDAVAGVRGLARLRLSSLEPGDLTDELLAVLTRHPCCVPHLHLPLQSGSEGILRRMNRQYTLEQYLSTIQRCRDALHHPAITTDLVVGFPGETEADFQATCQLVRQVGFAKIHAFPFSPRHGTAAARWSRQFVSPPVVRQRMKRLARLEQATVRAFRRGLLGRAERVLVERVHAGRARGRADRYFPVEFPASTELEGRLVSVRLVRLAGGSVHAVPLAEPDAVVTRAS